MELQRHTDFYMPVLKVLDDLKEHEVNSLIADTADACHLTEEERQIRTRKGTQLKYESNIQWAITDLCQGGFINRTERGVYTMAFEGLLILEDNPERPNRDYLEARSDKFKDFRHRKGKRSKSDDSDAANLFSCLREEDIEDDTDGGIVEKVSEEKKTSDAAEMLKKCMAAREAMVIAELNTCEVDAKIKMLREGINRSAVSQDVSELMKRLRTKNLQDFAIIIDLFDHVYKAYIVRDSELARQIEASATPICQGWQENDEQEKQTGTVVSEGEGRKPRKKPSKKQQFKKQPNKKLKVTFGDGTVLEGRYSADVFAAAIEKIGAERVKEIGLTTNGFPLVGTEAPSKYQYKEIAGGYFVPVNSSTTGKKKFLDEIAATLSLNIETSID